MVDFIVVVEWDLIAVVNLSLHAFGSEPMLLLLTTLGTTDALLEEL